MQFKCRRAGCENNYYNSATTLMGKQESGYCCECSLMINPIYARLVKKFKKSKRDKTAIRISYNDVEYMRKQVLATTFLENSLSRLGKVTAKQEVPMD